MYTAQRFGFATPIGTGATTAELVAAPTGGRKLVVQRLVVTITTAAAQTFTVGDGTITLFAAAASQAVGTWICDMGPLGQVMTANTALTWTPAAAGVGLTISGYGYYLEA